MGLLLQVPPLKRVLHYLHAIVHVLLSVYRWTHLISSDIRYHLTALSSLMKACLRSRGNTREHGLIGGSRSHFPGINDSGGAIGQPDQHEGSSPDAGSHGVVNSLTQRCCHCCIDGVPTLLQNMNSCKNH